MTVNINAYKEWSQQPWGKIMYRLIFAQLSHIKNKQVLDFVLVLGQHQNT